MHFSSVISLIHPHQSKRRSAANTINECFSYFPVSDLDGKLYDAYVAYPPPCAVGYSKAVETFAIDTLPQVLERACGYKLFIASRDCLPGQGKSHTVAEQVL